MQSNGGGAPRCKQTGNARSPMLYFGGLLLGAYRHGLLQYVGRVGSCFTDKELAEIA